MSKNADRKSRPKIIAELCQNHNGNSKLLEKMVYAAASAGATHIKIQSIFARNLVFRAEFEAGLKSGKVIHAIQRPWANEFKRLNRLELDSKVCVRFVQCCRDHGVEPLTTCFSRDTVAYIRKLGFKQIKVASYDCGSYQLLRDLAAAKFERIYISTGATHHDEICLCAKILRQSGIPHEFLHCVTIYPTPLEKLNLSKMRLLRKWGVPVGFSDHSSSLKAPNLASMAALYLGADLVERHFTLLLPEATKDGKISIGPEDLRDLVSFSKLTPSRQKSLLSAYDPFWRRMIGTTQTSLSPEEMLNRAYYRGRFASRRPGMGPAATEVIFNWEETSL